ncbi:MAG: 3'(2'),5'-bisphosphate nucleotidase CysQ [Flavobacteriaceae bacterium]
MEATAQHSPADAAMIETFMDLAIRAGETILQIRERGAAAMLKEDRSPVTEADTAAEAIILDGLHRAWPDIPVIAEEAATAGALPEVGRRFFLVDPLDGTKEFIRGDDSFTVNIALVEDRMPSAGVVLAPARAQAWSGRGNAAALYRLGGGKVAASQAIGVRPCPASPVAVASRSHRDPQTDAFLAERGVTEVTSIGSSLKFCLLAEGTADLYPRFGPTMEWDTAAGHAVLNAAGGRVTGLDGGPFLYGKKEAGFRNPGFIAQGG